MPALAAALAPALPAPTWGRWSLVVDGAIVASFASREELETDADTVEAFCRSDELGLYTPIGDYYPFAEWAQITED